MAGFIVIPNIQILRNAYLYTESVEVSEFWLSVIVIEKKQKQSELFPRGKPTGKRHNIISGEYEHEKAL